MNIHFQNCTFCLFNVLICTHISYYSGYSDQELSCQAVRKSMVHSWNKFIYFCISFNSGSAMG
ncbi:hypothetical protein C0J52_17253 [Blattella germanica]|nr:hypothetical protein C0J52_17253 [Blattella germanica]